MYWEKGENVSLEPSTGRQHHILLLYESLESVTQKLLTTKRRGMNWLTIEGKARRASEVFYFPQRWSNFRLHFCTIYYCCKLSCKSLERDWMHLTCITQLSSLKTIRLFHMKKRQEIFFEVSECCHSYFKVAQSFNEQRNKTMANFWGNPVHMQNLLSTIFFYYNL